MEMVTTSSAQGDDKFAAPSRNQKHAKTGVGHLIRRPTSKGLQDLPNNSPMERSWAWQLMNFPTNVPTMKIFLNLGHPCLSTGVLDKEIWRWRLVFGWICYDAHNTFLTLYEEL
ncbi:hypothetical protein Pyn_23894 [Prunus yedoensis var. nudiflora]|uniref:Uncharacterized protein n=1 Tax=Prunus yedoensis var. nudiflora TaxID=2094558 RepID=A0A314YKZ4_PRUYE|nr:hypothetical protein Pyn_23894 [Prunus yedoensis var. nudiflora]